MSPKKEPQRSAKRGAETEMARLIFSQTFVGKLNDSGLPPR